jgi:hypothetical protein
VTLGERATAPAAAEFRLGLTVKAVHLLTETGEFVGCVAAPVLAVSGARLVLAQDVPAAVLVSAQAPVFEVFGGDRYPVAP